MYILKISNFVYYILFLNFLKHICILKKIQQHNCLFENSKFVLYFYFFFKFFEIQMCSSNSIKQNFLEKKFKFVFQKTFFKTQICIEQQQI